jgi:hypothetical protein
MGDESPQPDAADVADEEERPDETKEPAESPAAPGEASVSPEEDLTGDPLFEVLWAKVLASWDDDKAHGSILEYSVAVERLPDLAGRYRALKDDLTKGERARKGLDAIVIAATQVMMSMRTPANTTIPLSITLSVAGLFACAVAFVAYAMLHPH